MRYASLVTFTAALLSLSLSSSPCPAQAVAAAQQSGCAAQPAAPVTDADRAFAAGDFARAESLYTAALAAAPTAANYAGLMDAQIEQNQVADALATAEKAAAALPASGDALALPAFALIRAGRIAEASPGLSKAFGVDHCSPLTMFALARLNDLLSRHLAASKGYAAAHHLAPGSAPITAAWIMTLAPGDRAATLKAFLAQSPLLPPAALERLATTLAILEQHLDCTPLEPNAAARLELNGLMLSGTHARSFGLKLKMNNADLPLLELDSGVAGIVLNPADARKAGVRPLTAATSGTYYAVADHIKIGNLEYKDCPVRVASAAALANSNSLIGTDFFRDHLQHIDYVLKTYTLTPYPTPATGLTDRIIAPEQKDWTAAFVAGSNLLIPTLVNKKGPFLFLLDTGTHITILSPEVNKQVLLNVRDGNLNLHGTSAVIIKVIPKSGGSDDDHAIVYGGDGKLIRPSQPIKVPALQFGRTEFIDDNALSYDITPKSHDTGVQISGLLGFSVLREYFTDIDYRNGLVKLAYDFNHLYTIRDMARDK